MSNDIRLGEIPQNRAQPSITNIGYHKVGLKVEYKWTYKTEFCYDGRHNNGEVRKELNCNILTNCGLVTPYDGIDPSPAKGTRGLPAPSHH